jgi:CheY-like chemotaxis protein
LDHPGPGGHRLLSDDRSSSGEDAHVDIVVVDDDPAGLELLRILLEADGHTVRASGTAAGALDLLNDAVPRVLVTDLMMGADRQDGFRLVDQVRRRPELDGLPVMALTGVTSARELGRARAAGADLCMTKPIDVVQFLRALHELTVSTRASREPD